MKVTPLAAGANLLGAVEGSPTISPDRLERAKAVASGQIVPDHATGSGDPQVDKINARRIKMKTQLSTNRDDVLPEQTAVSPEPESTISDAVEQTQSTEETRPLSPQFAALAKAKRALQVKERELAQREQALSSQPSGQQQASEDVMAKLKANPLGVLQEAGVTYDQLTEAILNNQAGSTPEINQLKAELKALKEELNGQFQTRDTQAEQQVLSEIRREAILLTNEGDYEAIRAARAQPDVVELIHRTWKSTGEILDVQQAAELVENQLIEEALPFAKIKKVQSRLTPQQEQQIAQTPTAPKPGTKIMRTLTNRDSATPIMDRRARAIAAMNGTLKKG